MKLGPSIVDDWASNAQAMKGSGSEALQRAYLAGRHANVSIWRPTQRFRDIHQAVRSGSIPFFFRPLSSGAEPRKRAAETTNARTRPAAACWGAVSCRRCQLGEGGARGATAEPLGANPWGSGTNPPTDDQRIRADP